MSTAYLAQEELPRCTVTGTRAPQSTPHPQACSEVATPHPHHRLGQKITAQIRIEGSSKGHPVQTSCAQAGYPEQGAAFGHLQVGDSTASRQPVPMLSHPTAQKCFLMVRQHLLFQSVPTATCHWAPLKRA